MKPLADLVSDLEEGEATSLSLVEQCLEQIAAPGGEGSRAFLAVDPDQVRADANAMDLARKAGKHPSPVAGIPISIKSLFDVRGFTTSAGSKLLKNAAPAHQDAIAVQRLRAAGFIIMGHTNMTEFAYSGLGLNPHYGTPRNPFDRDLGRIPGGSSSGAAVSVTDGMSAVALGTDTGGSCRIPAAFCGLTGFKPTARRVPLEGAFPLSHSLDSVGPIGKTVSCCALTDAVLANETPQSPESVSLSGLKLGVLRNYVLEDMETCVADAFDKALAALERAGATLVDVKLPDLEELPRLNARGGMIAAEAYRIHLAWLDENGEDYDPRVRVRIEKAKTQAPGEHADLLETRRRMIGRANDLTRSVDALVMPTTPFQAPLISDLEDDEAFGKFNLLALRNPTVANFLDRCAISVPMASANGRPVGLSFVGEAMGDHRLLTIAASVQSVLPH